jgi:MGT family glycosyltransferase
VSRVLITVPPLTGHVNPTVSLGTELSARGHQVAWTGLPGVVDTLLPADAHFLPLVGTLGQTEFDQMQRRGSGLRGAAALKFLWEDFIIPYAAATAPELLELVRGFDPHVLVVDQQAVAGPIVARQLGVPWATSATTSAELTDPLAQLPKVDAWVRAKLTELQLELGIIPAAAAGGDLRFSDRLIIAFTTEALLGPVPIPTSRIRFVGPSIAERPESTPFPWEWLDPERRHVLVTLGTVNADVGGRFFATAIEALAATSVQAVVVAPPDQVVVPAHAANVLVRAKIPQLAVLERMDAVVTHGGHNTVCESLARGLPLVLAPIRDDQPIVADQVVRAGAGVRVRFGRVGATELCDAVGKVLDDPSYRIAACAIRRSFREAGGAASAADAVEELLLEREPAR